MKVINIKKEIIIDNERLEILNDVSIDFTHSGIYLINGQNGSGKTTLLNILAGFSSYEGEIYLGSKLADSHMLQTNVEYCLQNNIFFEEKSVLDNILVYLRLKNEYINLDLINNLMKKMKISEFASKKIYRLSGGERKKVSILRSSLTSKQIILFDEPLSGLDENIKIDIIDFLNYLSKEKLIILSNHENITKKLNLTKVLELKNGRLLRSDFLKKSELFSLKSNDYLKKNTFYIVSRLLFNLTYKFAFSSLFLSVIFISIILYQFNYINPPVHEVKHDLLSLNDFVLIQDNPQLNDDNRLYEYGMYISLNTLTKDNFSMKGIRALNSISNFTLAFGSLPKYNDEYLELLILDGLATTLQEKSDYTTKDEIINTYFNFYDVNAKIVGIIKDPLNQFFLESADNNIINSYYGELNSYLYTSSDQLDKLKKFDFSVKQGVLFMNVDEDRILLKQLMEKGINDPLYFSISSVYLQIKGARSQYEKILILTILSYFIVMVILNELLVKSQYGNFLTLYLFTKKGVILISFIFTHLIFDFLIYFITYIISENILMYHNKIINNSSLIKNIDYLKYSHNNSLLLFTLLCSINIMVFTLRIILCYRKSKDDLLKELSY